MIQVNGMAHVILTVSSFEQALSFYGQFLPFLGLKQVFQGENQGRRIKFTAAARGAVSFRPGAGACTHHSRLPSYVWRAHWLCGTDRGRED